jgi:phenylacetate-CoA ligase
MNAIQLRRMILDAAEHVPFYRRHWRQAGVDLTRIGSAVHLEFLPVVRESDLLACPPEDRIDRRYLLRQGVADAGSSDIGQPFELPEDTRTLRRQRARFMRAMNDVGYSFGDRVLSLGAPPFPSGATFLRWTFVDARVNEDVLLAKYIKVRPHVLHAPLPSLLTLAHQLKKSPDVSWRPRVVVSTARSLTDADRVLLEATFGVGIADFYSTRALGLIAYAKPGMKGYQFITNEFHVEVLPAALGQRGGPERLVVTDLVAGTMPLIRFDTGDLVLREAPRPGALTAPPVVGIMGREPEEPLEVDGELPHTIGTPDFADVPTAASRPTWSASPLYAFRRAPTPVFGPAATPSRLA